MLDAAAARHFDVLLVWRFDRLGRDLEERIVAEAALARAGVRIVSLTDADIDPNDPVAPLLKAIRAGTAAMESALISARTRPAIRAIAQAGRYIGSRKPF